MLRPSRGVKQASASKPPSRSGVRPTSAGVKSAGVRPSSVKLEKFSSGKAGRPAQVSPEVRPVKKLPAPVKPVKVKVKPQIEPEQEDEQALGTEVVTEKSPSRVGLTKAQTRYLDSKFGNKKDVILDLLEGDDHDGANLLIFRSLIQMYVDILPVLERNIRKSKGQKGAYQLNQTVDQMMRTIDATQSMRDKSQLGQAIVQRHITPAMMNLANQMMLAFVQIENGLKTSIGMDESKQFADKILDPLKRGIADYFQTQLESITENVARSLS